MVPMAVSRTALKKQRAKKAAQDREDLYLAFDRIRTSQNEEFMKLSNEMNLKYKYVRDKYHLQAEKPRRSSSLHNAKVHLAAATMEGGGRGKLAKIARDMKENPDAYDYPTDLLEATQKKLEEKKASELPKVKSLVKGKQAFANAEQVKLEAILQRLHKVTGMRFVAVAVRGEAVDQLEPWMTCSGEDANFLHLAYRTSLEDFSMRFEAYAIGGLRGLTGNSNVRLKHLKQDIRATLHTKLQEAANNKNLKMTYVDFDSKITDEYGVVVRGWPESIPFKNASDLNVTQLRTIKMLLEDGVIKFKKQTSGEKAAWDRSRNERRMAGEVLERPRKKRSDAGVKRATKKPARGAKGGKGKKGDDDDMDVDDEDEFTGFGDSDPEGSDDDE